MRPVSHATAMRRAAKHLAGIDRDWARLVAEVGPCSHIPVAREPYEALIRAVSHQQVHARAAEAILGRMLALHPAPFPTPAQILATTPEDLRACGFSLRKAATIHGIARAAQDGVVPALAAALAMDDEHLVERLTGLAGIGRWTVEMLLISTLARLDVLPVDDFGVREGYRALKRLPTAPRPRELAAIGVKWAPYRSVAAWYLWRAADREKIKARSALAGPGSKKR